MPVATVACGTCHRLVCIASAGKLALRDGKLSVICGNCSVWSGTRAYRQGLTALASLRKQFGDFSDRSPETQELIVRIVAAREAREAKGPETPEEIQASINAAAAFITNTSFGGP